LVLKEHPLVCILVLSASTYFMSLASALGVETSHAASFSSTLKFRSLVTNSWTKCLQDGRSRELSEEERKFAQEIIDRYDDGNHTAEKPPYRIMLFHEASLLGHKKWFEIHLIPSKVNPPAPQAPSMAPPPFAAQPPQLQPDVQRLRAEIASLYQENAQHLQQVVTLSEEKVALEHQCAAEREARQAAERTAQGLLEEKARLVEYNTRLTGENTDRERSLQAERAARTTAERDLVALRQQVTSLTQENRRNSEEIARLTARSQRLSEVLQRLESPLSTALQEIAGLRT